MRGVEFLSQSRGTIAPRVTSFIANWIQGQEKEMPKTEKPNVLVIWGDDIGYWNISH
jgi:hypothetical protein